MRLLFAALLLLGLLGCVGNVTNSYEPVVGADAEIGSWVRDSIVIKKFLGRHPAAELSAAVLNSARFSNDQKELFLEACNKKWKEDFDYLVVSSKSGEEELTLWMLPDTKKTDCFAWSGLSPKTSEPQLVISGVAVSDLKDRSAKLVWKTNISSGSMVRYSADKSLSQTAEGAIDTENHSVTLTGLKPETRYFFQVVSKTEVQEVAFVQNSFITAERLPSEFDSTPFEITDVSVSNVSSNAATVSWKTSLPAVSTLYYGSNHDSLTETIQEETAATSHSVTLEDLEPVAPYFLKIKAVFEERETETPFSSFITEKPVDFSGIPSYFYWRVGSGEKLLGIDYGIRIDNQFFEGIIPMRFELLNDKKESLCSETIQHRSPKSPAQIVSYKFSPISPCYAFALQKKTYSYSLEIDYENSIPESDERNNTLKSSETRR